MKRIFEVKTDLTTVKNAEFIKNLGEEDRKEIMDLDLDLGVDVVKNDLITSYIVCNELNIEKMKDVLKKHGITYEIGDVTAQVVGEDLEIDEVTGEDLLERFDPEYEKEV
jgi:hypothetical protein